MSGSHGGRIGFVSMCGKECSANRSLGTGNRLVAQEREVHVFVSQATRTSAGAVSSYIPGYERNLKSYACLPGVFQKMEIRYITAS